ncbi:UNVERIFIED_CONTAM: hypothetical protein Scaly_2902500 [Sesamum calycinum]|uniref:Retrotransposon gag domain-containing protein n=1 Tax=Sesamum calycinum TaxID=2727403 RepID=A0AAW2L5F8_9LAMI
MAEGKRMKDIEETQRKQEVLLIEEKAERIEFDGEELRAWIRKCSRYFQIANNISDEQKVLLLLFILKVRLKGGYKDIREGGREMPGWREFIEAIFGSFDDIEPKCMVGEFNKQQQTGSVSEYLETFEELKPYVMIFYSHFPESYFTASFMSGLEENQSKCEDNEAYYPYRCHLSS